MGRRRYSSAGSGSSGTANLRTMLVGVLAMVIGLIMISLAMTTIGDMLDDNTITWANYPGAEDVWGMVPMMMGIGLIIFGVLLGWMGYGGRGIGIRTAIMAPLVAIVMVIFAPVVMSFVEDITGHADVADFTGIDIFQMIPMLYAISIILMPGILGYLGARGGKE